MATAALIADPAIINIISGSDIDETGLTLRGQLDRAQYVAVNKFLEVAGAKWNKSQKRHIFQPGAKAKIQALLGTGEIIDDKKQYQAFYTPKGLAEELVAMAGIGSGMDVLEPSAGEGAIALAARKAGGNVWCIELNPEDACTLKALGFNEIAVVDFLQFDSDRRFDRIVMNPPFTGAQDIKHVTHAFRFLKPSGKLYAIMSPSFIHTTNRKTHAAFNNFVHQHGSIVRDIEAGAFKESGTMVRTLIVELTA